MRKSAAGRSPVGAPELPDDQASVTSTSSTVSSFSFSLGVPPPTSIASAVHEVPSLLSRLVSGHTEEQVLAARKLFKYCRSGETVQRAVVEAKGVHVLLIMLDSLDYTVRDLCTLTLTDLAADDGVRMDIVLAPGGVSKVVQAMYKGVLEGQASAGKFLEMLATSNQEAVKAACCHAKVVRLLTKTLSSTQSPKATASALGALRAFCRDPSNVSKMVWAEGVPALVGVLQGGKADHWLPALELLAQAGRQSRDSIQAAATPDAVALLSEFIGSSEADLQAQSLAAEVLAAIAALPRKKGAALAALADHALPRACEVVRSLQEDPDAAVATSPRAEVEQEGERALLGTCAAIVAHLAQSSPDCARVVVYHTASLKVTVAALVATRQCGLAQALLQVSLKLATASSSTANAATVAAAAED